MKSSAIYARCDSITRRLYRRFGQPSTAEGHGPIVVVGNGSGQRVAETSALADA